MKKSVIGLGITVALFAGAAGVGLLWPGARGPHDPVYQGRKLSEYIGDLHGSAVSVEHQPPFGLGIFYLPPATRDATASALSEMGTNALPLLMDWLTSRGSRVDEIQSALLSASGRRTFSASDRRTAVIVAFQQLGPAAEVALPELLALMDDPYQVHAAVLAVHGVGLKKTDDFGPLIRACTNGYFVTEIHAMTALGALGERAISALPIFTNKLVVPGYDIRAAAVVACAKIRGPADTIVPLIAGSLQSSNKWSQGLLEPLLCDRMHLWALGEFGVQASNALPVISNYLNHADALVRAAAQDAVTRILSGQAN